MPNPDPRAQAALALRQTLATRDHPNANQAHPTNGDEALYPDKRGTYTKGLKQVAEGFVNLPSFNAFRAATLSTPPAAGVPDFEAPGIVTGAKQNGPQGGYAFQPLGFDSGYFGAHAPPALSSAAYGVELIELYWASLLRDVAFTDYHTHQTAKDAAKELSGHAEYAGPRDQNGKVTTHLLFRGGGNAQTGNANYFAGETIGPYISQFCIQPTNLGAQTLDQKVQTYAKGKDYMRTLAEWFAVQQSGSTAKPKSGRWPWITAIRNWPGKVKAMRSVLCRIMTTVVS